MSGETIEQLAEQIHKVYCKYHLDIRGTEYWTNGDYSKLDENAKEADRYMARFVSRMIIEAKIETAELAPYLVINAGMKNKYEYITELRKELENL